MRKGLVVVAFCFLVWLAPLARGQAVAASPSPAQAEMFYKHRLVEDAKRAAIQALFTDRGAAAQLRCKSLLARIACDEHRVEDAVELWQDMAKNHGDTAEGKVAAELVQQWSTLARTGGAPAIDDPRAAVWFSAAEFWLGDIPRQPRLDKAWLDEAEAAEFWLRKVVVELPKSPAAAEALAAIVRAHLGCEGTGEMPGRGALGLARAACGGGPRSRGRQDFETAIAKAELALGELKAAFPDSPEVPRLQFLVAHVYWVLGDEERSRPWLLKVAEEAPVDTFWAHLARLRLKNWRS